MVLLTSPSSGEGKTVTTLNLGIALAHDGHSVLVVDGDMRRGRCHAALGLRNNRGLSNVLTGGLSLQEGIQRTAVSGLALLSRGVLPPNPTELLGSAKMRGILQELREAFKFILIDAPPIVTVTDAAVLSVVSDGVLLVFDGQKTSTASAQKAVERLEMVRAPLLGVILNAVNLDNPHYSYYRDYSSYYGSVSRGEPISTGNGSGSREVAHSFYQPREFAQISNPTGDVESKDITATAHPEKVEEDRANGCENADGVRTGKEINEADQLEAIGSPIAAVAEPSSEKAEPAPVSKEFLNRLTENLTKAIGPIAPMVVRDHIAILGESESAFPKNRVDELLKLIQREIDELKLGLEVTVLEEEIGIVHIKRVTTVNKKRRSSKDLI